MSSDPALQLVAAVLVLATPAGVMLATGRTGRARTATALVAGAIGATVSLLADALAGPFTDPPARMLDAAIAAAVTATLAVLAARRLGAVGGGVVAVTWTALVYQPIIAAVVGDFPPLLQSLLGAVDYAGVLATHVALAGALLVVHLLPAPQRANLEPTPPRWGRSLAGGGLILLGATAWLVGVERVVDDATGRLLANAVVGIALAAVTWMLVEKIGWNRVTPAAVVPAAWGGWAAIGIGAPFLAPPALAGAAVLGGALGAALSGAGRRDSSLEEPRRSWTVGVIGATAAGGVIVALLADGFGLAATGTLVLAAAQLVAVLVATVLGALGGVVCWAVARVVIALLGFRARKSP